MTVAPEDARPSGTLDKWAVLDQIGWDPHPGQLQIAESKARHRVVSAGRRFGKSDLGGHELIPEAFLAYTMREELKARKMRREFWLVGPNYSDSEKEFRVIYNELSRLEIPFDKPGTYNDALGGNMHISLWGGAFQVHAKSAQHPEQLVGEGLHGVIMCEAAKMKERVWTKYIRPTLADYNGWSLHTSTPEGKNHFYDAWRRGQSPANREWSSWRMPSWANPYVYRTPTDTRDVRRLQELLRNPALIPSRHIVEQKSKAEELFPDESEVDESEQDSGESISDVAREFGLEVDPEILELIGDLTEESFNQEIAADFTEFVGRVFKDFDEEFHVFDLQYHPNWITVAAVDYGFTNPNVWLLCQIGPWGEIHVLDEVYQENLTADEFADEILRRGLAPGSLATFYPDPASPGDTRILEQKLRVRSSAGTGGELKHRLDAIRSALKAPKHLRHLADDNPGKMPTLRIDRKCVEMIREFNEYRYPEKREQNSTPGQELPMKKDDHTPEALGRLLKGFFGTPQQRHSGTRVTKARIKR